MDIACIIGRRIIPWSVFPITLTLQLDIYGASDTVKGQRPSLHHLTEPCLLQLPMNRIYIHHMLHRISCGHTVSIDFLLTQHEGPMPPRWYHPLFFFEPCSAFTYPISPTSTHIPTTIPTISSCSLILPSLSLSSSLLATPKIHINNRYIFSNRNSSDTYGHRLGRARLPVRSAKDKPQIG